MALGGICSSCGQYSHGLFTCHTCGARVCPNCVIPGTTFCKLCGGTRKI